MTAPSDHEAYLRAALHAAADSLEPRGDGLERIRARLQDARPRAVVWLLAAWNELRMRTPAAVQDAFYRLSARLWAARDRFAPSAHRLGAGLLAAWERYSPATAPGKHRTRTQSWLRPLAAMAVVMFIVAAGTYVAIDISTAVSPSSTNVHPQGPGPAGHPAAPSPLPSHYVSKSAPSPRRSSASPSSPPPASPGPSASPSCQSGASPGPSTSASADPSASPSPSPSASPSSSPAPAPSCS